MTQSADEAGDTHILTVEAHERGVRLDRFLARRLEKLSRVRLQAAVRAGHVRRSGEPVCEINARVRPGESYAVTLPAATEAEIVAEPIELAVVYEDAHLIVVDKPKGLTVHPAPGHRSGTLVNALLAHCGASLSGVGGVKRPGIVHRLDKDTTGLLVVAKTDAAHQGLAEQFAAHGSDGRLHRGYRAVVWGVPQKLRGVIDAPLGRSASNRTKMAVVKDGAGRRAATHYEVLKVFHSADGKTPLASLLGLTLETGRTHQVRVHLAHIGHPVLGDKTYGSGYKASASKLTPAAQTALTNLDRQALHAAELAFVHPASGKRLSFISDLPTDMARLVAALTGTRTDPKQRAKQASAKARLANRPRGRST